MAGICFLLAACRTVPRSPTAGELVRRSQPLLGTFVTITVYGENREFSHEAISGAFGEIRRVDRWMSIHRSDSEVSRVNRVAAEEPVEVSPELFEVLRIGQDISHRTGGAFDMTIRPLADLWGFIWKEYRMPKPEELERVLPRVNYRFIELNSERRTVRFLRDGISLDLGGIAKGYAVDRAIERLRSLGVASAMVRAGGDMRVIGAPPGMEYWEVQLEDPEKEGKRTVIPLRDAALSTSGNYENYFTVDGRRYSHILDPRTGLPVQGVAACTVVARRCVESDAWATACFVLGPDRSLREFGDEMPIRISVISGGGESIEVRESRAFPGLPNNAEAGY